MSHCCPAFVEVHAPIQTDHVAACGANMFDNPAVPVLKLITGTPGVIPAITERVYGRTNCS